MKISALFVSICCSIMVYAQIDSSFYYSESKTYQEELNQEYSQAESSPLDKEALINFQHLPFFPITLDFVVTARFEKLKKKEIILFQTSTARMPSYVVYGKLYFTINKENFELTVYQNPGFKNDPKLKNYLFLPFTDLTNGETTYGGGRYIDFWIPKSDEIVLNFNKAYNPYCAYSDKYSCPVPPKNNFLNIEINAGVMLLEQH